MKIMEYPFARSGSARLIRNFRDLGERRSPLFRQMDAHSFDVDYLIMIQRLSRNDRWMK